MKEPNFGESQLQHCVNAEITLTVLANTGLFLSPIIPTLPDEFIRPWDSGFFFPWIIPGPNPDHHGRNFFIQYKLSRELGQKGKEYDEWNEPYLRFAIPYRKKIGSRWIRDFHQWNALRELAVAGYSTFYATNHFLDREELFELARQRQLLTSIPFLDVGAVPYQHDCVTFTKSSKHFVLHSDPQNFEKENWITASTKIQKADAHLLREDNVTTFKLLQNLLQGTEGSGQFLRSYSELNSRQNPTPETIIYKFHLLRWAFYQFFGILMFRQ